MTANLHPQLVEAITARLEVARAAGARYGPEWLITRVHPYTDPVILGSTDGEGFNVVGTVDVGIPEQIHMAVNDPTQTIRDCEYHLKVLNRHAELPNSWGSCTHCRSSDTNRRGEVVLADWPCDDILDLLDVYPEVTR